jgi:hypothetical protein
MSGSNNGGGIYFGDKDAAMRGGFQYNHGGEYLAFYSGGSDQKARLSSDGYLGLGSTDPGAKLSITQTTGTDSAGIRLINGSLTWNQYSDAAGNLKIESNNGAELTVEADGNVGIGINNPTGKLHVNGSFVLNSAHAGTTTDDFDVSGCGIVTLAEETYTGFSGGVAGQVLRAAWYGVYPTFKNNDANGGRPFLFADGLDYTPSNPWGSRTFVFINTVWICVD